jgi:hypothetical protein
MLSHFIILYYESTVLLDLRGLSPLPSYLYLVMMYSSFKYDCTHLLELCSALCITSTIIILIKPGHLPFVNETCIPMFKTEVSANLLDHTSLINACAS